MKCKAFVASGETRELLHYTGLVSVAKDGNCITDLKCIVIEFAWKLCGEELITMFHTGTFQNISSQRLLPVPYWKVSNSTWCIPSAFAKIERLL
jgi:hypothetical protein